MKPTTTILIGAPLSGVEARFLRTLYADLGGTEALILANFDTNKRQIDFVVITSVYAALLELKNFRRPIFGQENGVWTYQNFAGARVRYSGENPWQQTKAAKFALSDEMSEFQKRQAKVPLPAGHYFKQFGAFVCIYPQIHPESQVTCGDHKVAVASYRDVIGAIKSDSISSTWNLNDWRRFAEEHLSLTEATLDEATNPLINEASEKLRAYRARIETVIGTALPPLFASSEHADYGQGLIDDMLEPSNFLLLGPSGSTKTFHLHHLALAISAKEEELPLVLEAKRYRGGDFWTLLRDCTAPLFRGDPKDLLDAMKLCGLRPVLMLDALNECIAEYLPDLLSGAQAFALHHEARVVLTSQIPVELPGDIGSAIKELSLPDCLQKRSIYAYHAGLPPTPDLDDFSSGFTNAYDLTIAGRCHGSGVVPGSRTALYDRYVRRCLPEQAVVASALLRRTAGEMAKILSFVWSRDTFERDAECFLAGQQASLEILDKLRHSRLIELTDDFFSFEHELLFDYFKAEHLRRQFSDVSELVEELRKPRNRDLLELIVSRFSSAADIARILSATDEASSLRRVLAGKCGAAAQSVVLQQCEALLDAAAHDLPRIEIACETTQVVDGRTHLTGLEIKGNRNWTKYDALLCHVVALSLDHPTLQQKFLALLDLTEWSLRAAVHKAAKDARFKPGPVWGEAVRLFGGVLEYGRLQVPCVSILSTLRTAQMCQRHYKKGLPIRAHLRERIHRASDSHFSMLALLEDLQYSDNSEDIGANLSLVQQGWASGIYILRIGALQLLQSMRRRVDESCPAELPRIREMLESFETDNIMVNTLLLETMASYGGLEIPVSFETALSEMRSVISPDAAADPSLAQIAESCDVSPTQFLAERAYGCLSRIFEDIFQGVYGEAYSDLSEEEKRDILCLAAKAREPGFWTDWIIGELFKCGGERALPIYKHFASGIDAATFSTQQSVASFVLGIEGYAQFADIPIAYRGGNSPEHIAWQTIGEILFWVRRANMGTDNLQRIKELWARFDGPVALAAADVFYQLTHSQWRLRDRCPVAELISTFAKEIRPILEQCITDRESLPTIFRYGGSRDRNVIRFLIEALGTIGDAATVPKLQVIADDPEFGRHAIEAIQSIQKNAMPQGTLGSLGHQKAQDRLDPMLGG